MSELSCDAWMDHEKLKCWVPLHRALEILGLRSHRKLGHLTTRGTVQTREVQGRKFYWSEEIERLATDRDRERSAILAPRITDQHTTPTAPPEKSRGIGAGAGLSGEEMSLLSEPVAFPPSRPTDPT